MNKYNIKLKKRSYFHKQLRSEEFIKKAKFMVKYDLFNI